MPRKSWPIILVAAILVVASTFSILYFFGSNQSSKNSIEISSPFVNSTIGETETKREEIEKQKIDDLALPATNSVNNNKKTSNEVTSEQVSKPASEQVDPTNDKTIKELQDKITVLEEKVASLETSIKNTSAAPSVINESDVKEYYIYLGTGSTNHRDWTEISSATAFVDTNNYSKIKSASFEAAGSIVGGEVHMRLKNKTTSDVFYETEIYNNSNSSVWKQSPSFQLSSGNNQYTVELRSSSGEMAYLDGARIRILLE